MAEQLTRVHDDVSTNRSSPLGHVQQAGDHIHDRQVPARTPSLWQRHAGEGVDLRLERRQGLKNLPLMPLLGAAGVGVNEELAGEEEGA